MIDYEFQKKIQKKIQKATHASPQIIGQNGINVEEKTFPIQGEHGDWIYNESHDITGVQPRRLAGKIPWRLAELAYIEYSRRYGTSQSLERIAERGGFSWSEFAELFAFWAIRQNTGELPS